MITPDRYGNALMYLNGSSNDSSAYMNGRLDLSGSNIGSRHGNAGYSNFDLAPAARMGARASIMVARWGLSRAALPANDDWSWRAVPT